jgi:hypothetical protein
MDAVVAAPLGLAFIEWYGTTVFLVTLQATFAVVRDLAGGRGQPVRVMARDTTQSPLARRETVAAFHLFGMPDRIKFPLAFLLHQEYGQETVKR